MDAICIRVRTAMHGFMWMRGTRQDISIQTFGAQQVAVRICAGSMMQGCHSVDLYIFGVVPCSHACSFGNLLES